MSRYITYYWLLVVAGAAVSFGFSTLIHSYLDVPRGVPLARFGVIGTITQIGLMALPFFLAPILTSFAFYGRYQRKPTKHEIRYLTYMVASSAIVLWLILFAVSGAWFWVLQGDIWFVGAYVLGPPIVAIVAFGFLFPVGNWIISLRIGK